MVIIGKFILGWTLAILNKLQKAYSWLLPHKRTVELNDKKKKKKGANPFHQSAICTFHGYSARCYSCVQGRCSCRNVPSPVSQAGDLQEHDVTPVQLRWISLHAQHSLVSSHTLGMWPSCVTGAGKQKTPHIYTTAPLASWIQLQFFIQLCSYCNLHNKSQMLLWCTRCYNIIAMPRSLFTSLTGASL